MSTVVELKRSTPIVTSTRKEKEPVFYSVETDATFLFVSLFRTEFLN